MCSTLRCLSQVFVPGKKLEHPPDFSVHDFALGRFAYIFVTLTMGWPLYLFFNATGRPYKSRWVNHFDPYSELFSKRERVEVQSLARMAQSPEALISGGHRMHFLPLLFACHDVHAAARHLASRMLLGSNDLPGEGDRSCRLGQSRPICNAGAHQ